MLHSCTAVTKYSKRYLPQLGYIKIKKRKEGRWRGMSLGLRCKINCKKLRQREGMKIRKYE
jgi:hypothetical protein